MVVYHALVCSYVSLCELTFSLHPLSILQLNEKFINEDCSQSCECTSTGTVCQPKSCEEGYICTIQDFRRDCYRGLCFPVFASS